MDQKEQTTLTRISGERYCYSKLITNKRTGNEIVNNIKMAYGISNDVGKLKLSHLFVTYLKAAVNNDVYFDVVKNGFTNEHNQELSSILWKIINPNTDNEIKVLLEGLNIVNSQIQLTDIENLGSDIWDLMEYKLMPLMPENKEQFEITLQLYRSIILPTLDNTTKSHIEQIINGKQIHDISLFTQYLYYVALHSGNEKAISLFAAKLSRELGIKERVKITADSLIRSAIGVIDNDLKQHILDEIALCNTSIISKKRSKKGKSAFTQKPVIVVTEHQEEQQTEQTADKDQ